MATQQYVIIWRAPYTSYGLLQLLPGGTQENAYSSTHNGLALVGWANDAAGVVQPVRWDATTLAPTLLAATGATHVGNIAVDCSSDASVIAGCNYTPNLGQEVQRWTSGGGAGSVLSMPAGGYTKTIWDGQVVEGHNRRSVLRTCSFNGTLNVGSVQGSGIGAAVRWDSGTPTALASSAYGYCCSGDGSVVMGMTTSQAAVWIGTPPGTVSYYPLCNKDFATQLFNTGYFCNVAGTAVWGSADPATGLAGATAMPCLWTNLTTPHTSSDPFNNGRFGTLRFLELPTGTNHYGQAAVWPAETTVGGEPIAVGFAQTEAGVYACLWTGTALTVLPDPSHFAIPEACSADASIIVGNTSTPVYWDAARTIHTLPLPSAADGWGGAGVSGCSRDGSLIYGTIIHTDPDTAETLFTAADMFFSPTSGLVDLSSGTNRRKFATLAAAPQWLGNTAELPLGVRPSVYLQAFPGNADVFASNALGTGGAFAITSGPLALADSDPACSTYQIAEPAGPEVDPQVRLYISDDGGRTWQLVVRPRSMGKIGEYLTRLRWLKLGHSRTRMLRLEMSDRVRKNIVGIYVDTKEGMS